MPKNIIPNMYIGRTFAQSALSDSSEVNIPAATDGNRNAAPARTNDTMMDMVISMVHVFFTLFTLPLP